MDSVDKLRKLKTFGSVSVDGDLVAAKMLIACATMDEINEIADEIEEEIAERYMELPVDADGVPIHVGDMVSLNGREPFEVGGVRDTRNQWHVFPYDLQRWYAPLDLHHVKPRTLEDVLLEFGDRVCNSGHQWGLDAADVVPKFAAEIRELMDGDAE